MFYWAKGSTLQEMIRAGAPGAKWDEWLEGWMVGFLSHTWRINPFALGMVPGMQILDVTLGDGPRPFLDLFSKQGATVRTIDFDELSGHQGEYGLITMLSFERENCLAPLDFSDPLRFLRHLLMASDLLLPGGLLVWSYLDSCSVDPDQLHSALEPAAVYQCVTRRDFLPFDSSEWRGTDRLTMYHDPDSLFVPQRTVLRYADEHQRVVRVLGSAYRRGPYACVERASQPVPEAPVPPTEEPAVLVAGPRPSAQDLSGRQLMRMLVKRAWRRSLRTLGRR